MALLFSLAVWFAPCARALDPARALTQYQSKHWGPEEGMPCNDVLSVIQTADGYLWLGTEEGLVRFDGVRTQLFGQQSEPAFERRQHHRGVGGRAASGRVCVFISSTGSLRRLVDGKVEASAVTTASTHEPGRILVQNPLDGACWVGTVHGLLRVGPNGDVTGPGNASDWPTEPINTVCRDGGGRLWIGTAQGIYRQREAGDGRHFERLADWKGGEVDCIVPARSGGLWIGSRERGHRPAGRRRMPFIPARCWRGAS